MRDSLFYCIAFSGGPAGDVYREQAKVLIESVTTLGGWDVPRVCVFTNDPKRPLRAELPERLQTVKEIIVPMNDFSHGVLGKLPACRFRFEAWRFIDASDHQCVVYSDTDVVVRSSLAPLIDRMDGHDMLVAEAKNRNMGRSRWFNGHITPDLQTMAESHRGIQGGTVVFRAARFAEISRAWAQIDAEPGRADYQNRRHLVTDQSSLNKLVLLSRLGRLPLEIGTMGFDDVSCPVKGQIDGIGEETVAHARMWHFWGTKDQWERVRLAREEYERLAHVPRQSPVTQECAYLVGLWHHRKPSERLQNVWRFMPDGRVSVTHPTISGTWWHDAALQAVFIRWDGGWGGEMFHLPPSRMFHLPPSQAHSARPTLHGRSLKRGHLTPQDEFTLKRRN